MWNWAFAGAICFGLVIGWISYRTLRRREGAVALSDIATVIGVVGGAAITTLFNDKELFGAYAVGLAVGFFLYFLVGLIVYGKDVAKPWMGD
jgi:O-antigen/teichoic acid export membrane protein